MKKSRIRDEIIEIGKKLFSHYGLKKTTMDDVARKLNKGKSTLYYYFKSKEELFKAVIDKEALAISEKVREAVAKESGPKKKLKAYALTRLACTKNLANYYRVMRDEYLADYELIQNIEKKHEEEHLDMIKDILKGGIKQKVFSIKNMDITAYLIQTQLKEFENPWAVEMDMGSLESTIEELLQILFNGIARG